MINWGYNRGNTLLEILLAMGIGSLMVVLLAPIYLSTGNFYQKLAEYTDAQYSARSVIGQLGKDIRGASSVEIASGGSKLILFVASDEFIQYYMENNQLYRQQTTSLGTVKIPAAESVSGLSFNGDAKLVTATIAITNGETTYRLSRNFCSRINN